MQMEKVFTLWKVKQKVLIEQKD